ncbi:MAG: HD domain-containing protein [Butyrivibrio sp.]|nr:HD domain-containing protein [Butyrivibrio sp.]
MLETLKIFQVDIMLALASVCAFVALFTFIGRIMSKRRKTILLLMQIGAAIWLEADRISYLYRGQTDKHGIYAARIGNFFVFLMTVFVLLMISIYLDDLLKTEGGISKTPRGLKISYVLGGIALFMVIFSQFTNLYYYFDENNIYHRTSWFGLSYVFPYTIMLLQIITLIMYWKYLNGRLAFSVLLFDIVCLVASFVQLFIYGFSFVDIAAVSMVVGLYIFALIDMNERVERANKIEIDTLKGAHESLRRLYEKTASALVTAIDAKVEHTKGHSLRVAGYSKEIARLAGMNEKECDEAYFAGLMHDVGKIGVSDEIIKKDTGLTDDEDKQFKKHSEIGAEFLENIDEFPSLYIGAKYHHERYDGKGYPEGLSGENIPIYARIVAVADEYDGMTSKKSYRDPMPQSTVREEILKKAGTQLDPKLCDIMVDMIDHDTQYMMREKDNYLETRNSEDILELGEMSFGEYKEHISEGIQITDRKSIISFDCQPEVGFDEAVSIPAIILFDSHDGCVHTDDRQIRILDYLEYGEIWVDGHVIDTAARDIRVSVIPNENELERVKEGLSHYDVAMMKYRDHVRIVITNERQQVDVTIALPDAIRYCYLAFSGEHCQMMNVAIERTDEITDEKTIPRIVQEISFVNHIEGDIPNVQVEGYRKAYSKAIPVTDGLRIKFRTMSLPTANLIWHCAYVLLFSAPFGVPEGDEYLEHCCFRLDGEDATENELANNELTVKREDSFGGWDEWKKINKRGYECEVFFLRRRNRITMETKNAGINIKCVTFVPAGHEDVYVALTGDQCALTDIRIRK